MRLTSLFLFVSLLSSGKGQEAGNLHRSTTSFVGEDQSIPPGDCQEDEMKKKVTLEACRRNPTWRGVSVDHDECRRLTGWNPRDYWWRVDRNYTQEHFGGMETEIAQCLDEHFRRAKEDRLWWALCDENDVDDENCHVPPTKVIGHYIRKDEEVDDDENGDLVMIKNILTEQEAYGLESIQKCMQKLLDNDDDNFFEERAFGDEEDAGIYKGVGGNVVTFMTGLLQLYLPGVASSLHRAMSLAHQFAGWDVPSANSMGMRNSEFLRYHRQGRLGVHVDHGSMMTISVSLSNPGDFYGGYFHLFEEDALFKVPRLSGIVFLAATSHGVTEILGGTRTVFVAELWDDDDTPVFVSARPDQEGFEEHKKDRMGIMKTMDKKAMYEQVGINEAIIGVQGDLSALVE